MSVRDMGALTGGASRLSLVLKAGMAQGHQPAPTGMLPQATRDEARRRFGNDWWKDNKEEKLATLEREGYSIGNKGGKARAAPAAAAASSSAPSNKRSKPRVVHDDDSSSDDEEHKQCSNCGFKGKFAVDWNASSDPENEPPLPACPKCGVIDMQEDEDEYWHKREMTLRRNVARLSSDKKEIVRLDMERWAFDWHHEALHDWWGDVGGQDTGLGQDFDAGDRRQPSREHVSEVEYFGNLGEWRLTKYDNHPLKDSYEAKTKVARATSRMWNQVVLEGMKEAIRDSGSVLRDLDRQVVRLRLEQCARDWGELVLSFVYANDDLSGEEYGNQYVETKDRVTELLQRDN